MSFETFDFNLKKIKEQLETYNGTDEKLTYLAYIRKELKRVIRCFNKQIYNPWDSKAEDCTERNDFSYSRYKLYTRIYRRDKHDIESYVNRDIKNKKDELISGLKTIEDDIDYFQKIIERKLDKQAKNLAKESNTKNVIQVDQDTKIEKFQKLCEIKNLQKYKTIPRKILFEIAKEIGMKVGKIEDFKSGEKKYQIARQYASVLKYKRKKRNER